MKQIQYGRQMEARAPQVPAAARVSGPPSVEGAGERLFRAALGAGGDLLKILARDHARMESNRAEEALLAADREFEEWKLDYCRTHQGGDALEAQRDFVARHEEISRRTLEDFGGAGEIFRDDLERKLALRGLYALKEGGAWQNRQDMAWERSLFAGQTERFQRMTAENPDDPDRIAMERRSLIQSWMSKNPGLDPSEFIAKLDDQIFEQRMSGFFAQERFDEGRALLNERSRSGFLQGKANIKGLSPEHEAIARREARANGIPEELALAVIMQESGGDPAAISHAGARGLMQLMPGTARELGVNADDPEQNIKGGMRYLKKMIDANKGDIEAGLASYNGGLGNIRALQKTGLWGNGQKRPRENAEYASRVLARMSGGSATPLRAKWDKRLKDAEEKSASETALKSLQEEIRASDGLNPDDRQARLYSWLDNIDDTGKRESMRRIVDAELNFNQKLQQTQNAAQGRQLYESVAQLDPIQAAAAIHKADVNPEARQRALSLRFGDASKETPAMRSLFRQGMLAIENGGLKTPEDRETFAMQAQLSGELTRKLLDYRPNAEQVSYTEIMNAAKALGADPENLQQGFEDIALARLPKDRKANQRDIQNTVRDLLIKDNGLFLGFMAQPAWQAIQSGKMENWLPKVESHEEEQLNQLLKQNGLKPTGHNRQLLKKYNLGYSNSIEWER